MLDRLDANSLVALHVLLDERHVTRAARRLGITQSSMSHRLARLRETLGDTLVIRAAGELLLTPRAQALAAPLAAALRALEAAVAPPERGEPALAVAPSRFVAGPVLARALGEVRFGVVGRQHHPALRGKLTTARWLAHGHVVVRLGNEQSNLIQAELARRGLSRRVALEVPSFLAGLFAVSTSDLLMNAPVPLVDEAAAVLKLAVSASPVPLPRVKMSLCWHERFQGDAGHRWVRDRAFDIVRPMIS